MKKIIAIFGLTKYHVFLFICICIKLIYMHYSIVIDKEEITTFAYLENIGTIMIDTGILLFLPTLLINRRKYVHVILFILMDIFVLANIWYSRNFHSYFPISLYFEFNNLDGLLNNILESISLKDAIIPLITIIAILFIYFKLPFNSLKNRLIIASSFLGTSILLILLFFSLIFLKYPNLKEKLVFPYAYNPMESTFRYGILYYFYMQAQQTIDPQYSKQELEQLEPLFFTKASCDLTISTPSKNIIFIIVESFISFASDLCFNSKEITPNLNFLKNNNIYCNNHVLPKTKSGESSDGQFIYLTGLLPLETEITTINYLKNTYITLPALLKTQHKIVESRMVIPTGPTFWRQDKTCSRYQIDSLFSKNDYPQKQGVWLNDEEVFKLAQAKDLEAKQPFLSVILTSSTHSPYSETFEKQTTFDFPPNYSNELKNYLLTLHYTDRQIGEYIHFLKTNFLYDNSIIIIASDHEAHAYHLNLPKGLEYITKEIPLYIINSPVDITQSGDAVISQADIYPTLLDITGIQSSWRGVGTSLLATDSIVNSLVEKKRRKYGQKISDIIIHSDYFKMHEPDFNTKFKYM